MSGPGAAPEENNARAGGVPRDGDYAAATAYLRGLKTRGVALGLERMVRFLAALGHPERAVPCIHVAGTNGKGSVAAMLEAVLRAAGWRTGLYTSPHLVRLGERIQVNRQALSPAEIAGYVCELRPVAAQLAAVHGPDGGPSYFEFMTAMALRHFERVACDIAVIEVGLGGRLDATNVVVPEVSVITSLGLDHCEVLGESLAAIATEKAGIIKAGRPLVIGRLPPEAETVVRKIAAAHEARVFSVRELADDAVEDAPATNLAGAYQRANAATATLAARQLSPRWRVGEAEIAGGLRSVEWPGRWQRVSLAGRTVIVDGAHNPEAAEALDQNLARLQQETGRAPIIVAGVLGLARARAVLGVCCRWARELHLVVPAQPRACTFEQLERVLPDDFQGRVLRTTVADVFPEAGRCNVGEPVDTVVVTGSLYLAGEVLARLNPSLGPAEGDLQDF